MGHTRRVGDRHGHPEIGSLVLLLGASLLMGTPRAEALSWLDILRRTQPGAPQVTAGADVKRLRFDWEPVKGAIYYVLLEKEHASSEFQRVGLPIPAWVRNAHADISVHRHDWPDARYAVAACNFAGCTPSAPISTLPLMLEAIGYFKASNTDFQDFFGNTVALSADGRTLAVGALFEAGGAPGINGDQADNSQDSAGAVYVFVNEEDEWRQQAYVKASNPDANDFFSTSIALSADGDTLVVGAPGEDGPGCSFGSPDPQCLLTNDSGAVYVFERTGQAWSQQALVKTIASQANQSLGGTVRLSADGNTFLVTATGGVASAFVFTRQGDTWTEGSLPASQPGALCNALALSGDAQTIARSCRVRSPLPFEIPDGGFIEIFVRTAGPWMLRDTLTQDPSIFASNVALDHGGETLAAGTLFDDNGLLLNVYSRQSDAWLREFRGSRGPNISVDALPPALAISLDGTAIAFGHIYDDSQARDQRCPR